MERPENSHDGTETDPPALPVRVFYDTVAPYYDGVIMAPFKARFTNQMEAEFLSKLFPKGSTLLDLGSGTGRSMALLGARNYQVFGVDISVGMIREALKRGVKTSVLGDLRYLPDRPTVFDGAFSMHGGLSHLPTIEEKTAALREIDRVMKKRCVLMIDVPNPYRKDRGQTYTVQWQAGQQRIGLRGHAWYPDQFEKIRGDLGFSDIRFLGDYAPGQGFGQGSRRLILLAKRS